MLCQVSPLEKLIWKYNLFCPDSTENYISEEPVRDSTAPLKTPLLLGDDYIHRRITAASDDVAAQPLSRPAPLFEVAQPETSETEAATEPLEAPPVSLLGRLIYCKLHVILLAIVVRILLALHHGYLFGDVRIYLSLRNLNL